ncbi:ADP-ribosyltransferase [Gordonia phage Sixama]|uniref:ADP-ribosyltransferase n=1 Tax=Gordonia phage Sixama TaxID=2653271 RepID=A0A5Q2F593_9CAUD|nr:ADP-ribosyltransferase exoenzyme toxin [Gordonia phage Sixama]QGF20254.1 ADP-ribosyltransferase [Gordonia phage Sixama]
MRAVPIHTKEDIPAAIAAASTENQWYIQRMAKIFGVADLIPAEWQENDDTLVASGFGKIRKVRTPEGEKKYNQPIGSIIKAKIKWKEITHLGKIVGKLATDDDGNTVTIQKNPHPKTGWAAQWDWAIYNDKGKLIDSGSTPYDGNTESNAIYALGKLTPKPKLKAKATIPSANDDKVVLDNGNEITVGDKFDTPTVGIIEISAISSNNVTYLQEGWEMSTNKPNFKDWVQSGQITLVSTPAPKTSVSASKYEPGDEFWDSGTEWKINSKLTNDDGEVVFKFMKMGSAIKHTVSASQLQDWLDDGTMVPASDVDYDDGNDLDNIEVDEDDIKNDTSDLVFPTGDAGDNDDDDGNGLTLPDELAPGDSFQMEDGTGSWIIKEVKTNKLGSVYYILDEYDADGDQQDDIELFHSEIAGMVEDGEALYEGGGKHKTARDKNEEAVEFDPKNWNWSSTASGMTHTLDVDDPFVYVTAKDKPGNLSGKSWSATSNNISKTVSGTDSGIDNNKIAALKALKNADPQGYQALKDKHFTGPAPESESKPAWAKAKVGDVYHPSFADADNQDIEVTQITNSHVHYKYSTGIEGSLSLEKFNDYVSDGMLSKVEPKNSSSADPLAEFNETGIGDLVKTKIIGTDTWVSGVVVSKSPNVIKADIFETSNGMPNNYYGLDGKLTLTAEKFAKGEVFSTTPSMSEPKKSSPKPKSTSDPVTPAPVTSAPKPFISNKQKSFGKLSKDSSEKNIPKKSLADGTYPAVGQTVVDEDGNEGIVTEVFQSYTAVHFNGTKKAKTVSNKKLNLASASSSASAPAATLSYDDLTLGDDVTVDGEAAKVHMKGQSFVDFKLKNGSVITIFTSDLKDGTFTIKSASSSSTPATPAPESIDITKLKKGDVLYNAEGKPVEVTDTSYDPGKFIDVDFQFYSPKEFAKAVAEGKITKNPPPTTTIVDWQVAGSGKHYWGTDSSGLEAKSGSMAVYNGVIVRKDGSWIIIKNGSPVKEGTSATQEQGKKDANAEAVANFPEVLKKPVKPKKVEKNSAMSPSTGWHVATAVEELQAKSHPYEGTTGGQGGTGTKFPPGVLDTSAPLGSKENPRSWSNGDLSNRLYGLWMTSHHKQHWGSKAAFNRVANYTGSWYTTTTDYLKPPPSPADPTLDKQISELDKAFEDKASQPLKEWIIVTRGGSQAELNGLGLTDYSSLSEIQQHVGKTIASTTFKSTSIAEVPAFGGNCRFIYKVPPGIKGVYVAKLPNGNSGISHHPGENEVLLPRDMKVKIVDVVSNNHTGHSYDVVLEVIP